MTSPTTISSPQLARLAGLSERHLRRLAKDGWLPDPVRSLYPLVPTIHGLLRYYRKRDESRVVQDTYPSLEACSRAVGFPVAALKAAKRKGCPALRGNQVALAPLLAWWFEQSATQPIDFERERALQTQLQNAKLQVMLRQLKGELLPAEEVRRLGAELGGAIRKVITRSHRLAPSLVGQPVEIIERRLKEQEAEAVAQIQIMDDRLKERQESGGDPDASPTRVRGGFGDGRNGAGRPEWVRDGDGGDARRGVGARTGSGAMELETLLADAALSCDKSITASTRR